MKITIILLAIGVIACFAFLTACKKRGVQAEVDAAVAQEQYQFIALLDPEGKWTRPVFSDIPAWYFETTGIRIQQMKPETREADLAYMKSYNDALYQTLKAQGKFHVVEENIARVKANLDKYEQSKKSQ
ncbi:MAG: hypothetical protein JWR26_4093 [Pedosphaera sp.]|nr:hypothetical protein [Pedosphaera sp.]